MRDHWLGAFKSSWFWTDVELPTGRENGAGVSKGMDRGLFLPYTCIKHILHTPDSGVRKEKSESCPRSL